MRCASCGAQFADGGAFCPACGSPRGAEPPDAKPTGQTSRRRDVFLRALRLAVATLIALAVLAAVGLVPVWSPHVPWPTKAADTDTSAPKGTAWFKTVLSERPVAAGRVVDTTLVALGEEPDAYQGRLVKVPVTVGRTKKTSGGTLVNLSDGEATVAGFYPGKLTAVRAGTRAVVAGIPSPTGEALLVLAASRDRSLVDAPTDRLSFWSLIAAAGFFVVAVFLRVRRAAFAKREARGAVHVPAVTMLLVALALSVAGCGVNIKTQVEPDGSGTVITMFDVGASTMDEIKGLPNAEEYIDSWTESMESRGVDVSKSDERIRLERRFSDPTAIDTGTDPEGSWTFLRRIELPDGTHTVFLSDLDTTALLAEQGVYDEDGSATEELNDRMSEATFDYNLELPGAIVSGGPTRWKLSMGDSKRLFAESVLRSGQDLDAQTPSYYRFWGYALWWVAGAAAAILVWALIAYPFRKRAA